MDFVIQSWNSVGLTLPVHLSSQGSTECFRVRDETTVVDRYRTEAKETWSYDGNPEDTVGVEGCKTSLVCRTVRLDSRPGPVSRDFPEWPR